MSSTEAILRIHTETDRGSTEGESPDTPPRLLPAQTPPFIKNRYAESSRESRNGPGRGENPKNLTKYPLSTPVTNHITLFYRQIFLNWQFRHPRKPTQMPPNPSLSELGVSYTGRLTGGPSPSPTPPPRSASERDSLFALTLTCGVSCSMSLCSPIAWVSGSSTRDLCPLAPPGPSAKYAASASVGLAVLFAVAAPAEDLQVLKLKLQPIIAVVQVVHLDSQPQPSSPRPPALRWGRTRLQAHRVWPWATHQ